MVSQNYSMYPFWLTLAFQIKPSWNTKFWKFQSIIINSGWISIFLYKILEISFMDAVKIKKKEIKRLCKELGQNRSDFSRIKIWKFFIKVFLKKKSVPKTICLEEPSAKPVYANSLVRIKSKVKLKQWIFSFTLFDMHKILKKKGKAK